MNMNINSNSNTNMNMNSNMNINSDNNGHRVYMDVGGNELNKQSFIVRGYNSLIEVYSFKQPTIELI